MTETTNPRQMIDHAAAYVDSLPADTPRARWLMALSALFAAAMQRGEDDLAFSAVAFAGTEQRTDLGRKVQVQVYQPMTETVTEYKADGSIESGQPDAETVRH